MMKKSKLLYCLKEVKMHSILIYKVYIINYLSIFFYWVYWELKLVKYLFKGDFDYYVVF